MPGERLFKRGRVWFAQFYEDLGDGTRRRVQRSTRCTDKAAAAAVCRGWERAAADPKAHRAAGAMMRQALALLVHRAEEDERAGKTAADTVKFYRWKAWHLARIFEPNDKPFLLARLSADDVDRYISVRRAEPAHRPKKGQELPPDAPRVQDTTIAKELQALGRALKLAIRAGLWQGDPAAVMPVDFGTGYTPVERWLPLEEAMRLLAELVPDRAARVAFILATSARWGESERAERTDSSSRAPQAPSKTFVHSERDENRRASI